MPKISNLTELVVNAEVTAFAKLLDGGFIDVYSGPQPETADTPLSSQRLAVTLKFSSTGFGPASGGTVIANQIEPGVASKTVNPVTWARLYKADHKTVVMDVSVGTKDSVMVLPTVNVPAGITVTCSYFSHSVVKSNLEVDS